MTTLKDIFFEVVLLLFILYFVILIILSPIFSVILLSLGYIFLIIIFRDDIKTVLANIAKRYHSILVSSDLGGSHKCCLAANHSGSHQCFCGATWDENKKVSER